MARIFRKNWGSKNRLHELALAEEFLAKHLGGRFEPIGEIEGHSGVIKYK